MRIQITNAREQETEEHKLSGKRFEKRFHFAGIQGTVLGIREGAKANDRYAFVVKYDSGETVLASRRDIKVL